MRKKWIAGGSVCVLLAIWAVRYLVLNQGHFLAYPYHMHTIEEYQIGDTVEYESNQSYYGFTFEGCSISVDSARILELDDFCDEYRISSDSLSFPMDRYLELTVTISNQNDTEEEFAFSCAVLRGADWWSNFASEATVYANKSVQFNMDEYNQVAGISLSQESSVTLNLVYGLQYGSFTNTRWNQLTEENMWLILTTTPTEKRIRICVFE